MAFFGLTALGPHPFTILESNNPTLHLFTENDVKTAWKKSGGSDKLQTESLGQFLRELYCGSPPKSELNRLSDALQSEKTITWSALREAFMAIQEQALLDETKTVHLLDKQQFVSNHDYRDAVRRHNANVPKGMTSKLLTTNQSYGWKKGNEAYEFVPHKIRGKKSCPETLYCNELIKMGFYY